MGNSIGPRIQVQGEAEFKKSLQAINAGLKVNASEMAKVSAEYDKNDNSMKALTARNDALEKSVASQTDKVDLLRQALENSTKKYGEADIKTMRYAESLNRAEAELITMNKALKENSGMMDTAQDNTEEYSASVNNAGQQNSAFGVLSSAIFKKFGLDAFAAEQSASDSVGSYVGAVNKGATETEGAAGLMGLALEGAPVVAAGAVVKAVYEIVDAVQEAREEVEYNADKMAIALSLTDADGKIAAESIKRVYNTGIAESKEAAEQALTVTYKLLGQQGEEAERTANKLLTISAVFGEDIPAAARSASTMMNTFGITSEQALDLMVAGLSTTANKQSDLLDTLNEYSSSFDRMGYSAEEFLATIIAGTDAGAYNADKSGDVIKEFYNKAAGGTQSFADALTALGMDSEKTMAKITGGGDVAKQTLSDVAEKLNGVTDESKKARIASELFGSQWEDVGMKATLALTKTNKSIAETEGKAEEAYTKMSENTSVVDEGFNRAAKDAINGILYILAHVFAPGITSGIKGVTDSIKGLMSDMRKAENESKTAGDNIKKNLSVGNVTVKNSTVPRYARGTSNHPGGLAVVGEEGPELVSLPSGSKVYPNKKTVGGTTNIYNVTIAADTLKQAGDAYALLESLPQRYNAGLITG